MGVKKQAVGEPTATAEVRSVVLVGKAADEIVSSRRELEDDYSGYYDQAAEQGLIRPPYNLRRLEELVQTNNTLGPCIDCMVTNVDGTGWEIERADGAKMEDADRKAIQPAVDFFNECAPMLSFRSLRQRMRREMEATGNGYLEVIRNVASEIVFCGPLESKMMRMGRLSGPAVPVAVTMMRGGKEITFTQYKRERRFAQKVGADLIWFREFGSSRDLDKFTGQWAPAGVKLRPDRRATEVLFFSLEPDILTPYGVPRWINQTPSVLGSRQAEEYNLEFFANGGTPPYLVIVQGGQLAEKTVQAVREALNQKGAHARVQVIEAFSTSGSIDGNSSVQVKVERFGAEKQNDAMFQQYDKDCENRIRRSFRVPEILIGKTEQMNFATAQASYLVAEAQVFKPERDQFDEIISTTLLPELLGGSRDYVFRSKPISIIDAQTQLAVIAAANSTGLVDKESVVTQLSEIGGMDFKTLDISHVPESPDFAQDPLGNVIPIERAKPGEGRTAKKADETEPLQHLLGCTLAVMRAQDNLAV